MITQAQARASVLQLINETYAVFDDSLIILDELTQEIDLGWVFFYDSKRYIEADDFDYALAGNGPVVVIQATGEIFRLGSAEELTGALANLEIQTGYLATKTSNSD